MGNIVIMRATEIDEHDVNQLKFIINDIFDYPATDQDIVKLIETLCSKWDLVCDTLGRDEFTNIICKRFLKMRHPRYGDTEQYKKQFREKVEEEKDYFKNFFEA